MSRKWLRQKNCLLESIQKGQNIFQNENLDYENLLPIVISIVVGTHSMAKNDCNTIVKKLVKRNSKVLPQNI